MDLRDASVGVRAGAGVIEALTSYQSKTIGAHLRHAVSAPSKAQWDELKREYVRVKGGPLNDIALVEDLIAIGLAFLAGQPDHA